MSVVQVFIVYFWIYVLKLKNTFWNIAMEVSAECYLTVGYILPGYFEFWIFLRFCLWEASVLKTQMVNSEVSS